MKLIEALACGIRGAESGTATIYQRGTTTPTTSYEDMEGSVAGPADGVWDLDAYGAAVVYVGSYVTVVVRDSDGETVRTFTVGDSAGALEVRSTSFNGSAYSGGAIAPGNPMHLQTILNRWITSAGAVDWKVLANGVEENLQDVIGAFAGIYYNVASPEFGAELDGTTNDLAALQAAIDAANSAGGGVVWIPGGKSLLVTGSITLYDRVKIRCGPGAKIIASGVASQIILVSHAATVTSACLIEDLTIESASHAQEIIEVEAGAALELRRCVLGGAGFTGDGVALSSTSKLIAEDTRIYLAGTDSEFVTGGTSNGVNRLRNCYFENTFAGNVTGAGVTMYGGLMEMCTVYASAATGGTWKCVDVPDLNTDLMISGNRFVAGAGQTSTGVDVEDLTDSDAYGVYIENNTYLNIDTRVLCSTSHERTTHADRTFGQVATSGVTATIDVGLYRRYLVVRSGSTGALDITLSGQANMPIGADFELLVKNNASGDVTVGMTTPIQPSPASFVVPSSQWLTLRFVKTANDALIQVGDELIG